MSDNENDMQRPATKTDLRDLRAEMATKTDLRDLRAEMATKTDLSESRTSMRSEWHADLSAFEKRMTKSFSDLVKEFLRFEGRVTGWFERSRADNEKYYSRITKLAEDMAVRTSKVDRAQTILDHRVGDLEKRVGSLERRAS